MYVLGTTGTTTGWYSTTAFRLSKIDTQTGAAQVIRDLPKLATLTNSSLTISPTGTLVLAAQANATTIQIFELNTSVTPPTWVGYASVAGQLQDGITMPDSLELSTLNGTAWGTSSLTATTLAARQGASSVPDTDKDGVIDMLDDCPGTYDPAQTGCPDVAHSALYASDQLLIGNSVSVTDDGTLPVIVSTGTLKTTIGVEAKVGTVISTAPELAGKVTVRL